MRILQLSTHTTLIPNHGGKLRSHHVARVLEEEGFEVRRLAFCSRVPEDLDDPREPIVDIGRLPFWGSKTFADYGPSRFIMADYLFPRAALESPHTLAAFDALVRAAAPDVILLEHPWTWPLLARLEEVRSGAVPLVYNSQNVEIALKHMILAKEGLTASLETLEEVEALERGLVRHAAGVATCTHDDANVYAGWGARRVVVAANGGVRRAREHLLDILPWPLTPEHHFALLVGSEHPPNISGFMELVAPSLPLLRPQQRIVLAGRVGPAIEQVLSEQGLTRVAEGRLISLGPVDEFCLDCCIANANAVLLPIQYGGGSNVKTAEALLSGRRVVATEISMRGFDALKGVPGLAVASDADAFGAAMLTALDQCFQTSAADHPALAALLWDSTIVPLVELLRKIERDLRARPK